VGVAVVCSIRSPRRLSCAPEIEDFEQELVDQYALATAASGVTDGYVSAQRAVLFEFIRFVGRPVWEVTEADADRYLLWLRVEQKLALSTRWTKAAAVRQFFDFLVLRYQGDIHALTDHVVAQPIDEFNRPSKPYHMVPRVPPAELEIEALFAGWRAWLPQARKFLPAARDYLAASLWHRVGLRISESVGLDIRDWRPDHGDYGKLHVRFGKGSGGRGPKERITPAINGVDVLLTWWLTDIRHQFGNDWADPDAPLLPSERRDQLTGRCSRAGANALRTGLADAVMRHLPDWQGRLTPHGLRHFCASSLYARAMDLKAIQESPEHVHERHVEQAWVQSNTRVAARLIGTGG
jgi:integrase